MCFDFPPERKAPNRCARFHKRVLQMKIYIKKYIILFLVIQLLSALIPVILKFISPEIFTQQISEGVTQTFGNGYFQLISRYILNIIIIKYMWNDMIKMKIKNNWILILTFFSGFMGIIFFLFIIFESKLSTNENRIN